MNWFMVAANALWIIGLAWAVALFGCAYWVSFENRENLRAIINMPDRRAAFNGSLMLFCLGLGLITVPIWAKVLWFALALFSLISSWILFRSK